MAKNIEEYFAHEANIKMIDEIIKLIKTSKDTAEARNELMSRTWPAKSIVSLIDLNYLVLSQPVRLYGAQSVVVGGCRPAERQL